MIARELLFVYFVGAKLDAFDKAKDLVYHGRRYRICIYTTMGYQLSPFLDNTRAGSDVVLQNLTAGKKLRFSPLVPEMIERYGFYEGRGTPYRIEPSAVLAVLDYLQARINK